MPRSIDRLEFQSLAPELQRLLSSRVDRLGYLGDFFRIAGNLPAVLVPFVQMTDALKDALPDRLTEVVALTVATLMANDYERNQHERLSIALGYGEPWIRAVERISPERGSELSEVERTIQRLAIAMVERRADDVPDLFDRVIEDIGPERGIAIVFLIGRYLTHAMIVAVLRLAPPVASPLTGQA